MTEIQDNNQLLKFACEDLRAIQTVITTVEDHPVYDSDHDTLIVVRRALGPIISDIQEAVDNIDKALKETKKDDEK